MTNVLEHSIDHDIILIGHGQSVEERLGAQNDSWTLEIS